MSNEKFINIGSIKSNKLDHDFVDDHNNLNDLYDNSIQIFQMQGKKNTSCGSIIKVGLMKEVSDILIKEFNIPKFKCYLISKIYNMETLKQLNDTGRIQMLKMNISKDDKTIASLCYNFNTSSHVMDYISKELCGFYSITLHFKENEKHKFVNMGTHEIFPGNEEMMIELTKCLLDDKTQSILNKLI